MFHNFTFKYGVCGSYRRKCVQLAPVSPTCRFTQIASLAAVSFFCPWRAQQSYMYYTHKTQGQGRAASSVCTVAIYIFVEVSTACSEQATYFLSAFCTEYSICTEKWVTVLHLNMLEIDTMISLWQQGCWDFTWFGASFLVHILISIFSTFYFLSFVCRENTHT